jgi:hypothetical protein
LRLEYVDLSFPPEIIEGARVHVFRRFSTAAKTSASENNKLYKGEAAPVDATDTADVPPPPLPQRVTSAARHVIGRASSMVKQLYATLTITSTSGVVREERGPASKAEPYASLFIRLSSA